MPVLPFSRVTQADLDALAALANQKLPGPEYRFDPAVGHWHQEWMRLAGAIVLQQAWPGQSPPDIYVRSAVGMGEKDWVIGVLSFGLGVRPLHFTVPSTGQKDIWFDDFYVIERVSSTEQEYWVDIDGVSGKRQTCNATLSRSISDLPLRSTPRRFSLGAGAVGKSVNLHIHPASPPGWRGGFLLGKTLMHLHAGHDAVTPLNPAASQPTIELHGQSLTQSCDFKYPAFPEDLLRGAGGFVERAYGGEALIRDFQIQLVPRGSARMAVPLEEASQVVLSYVNRSGAVVPVGDPLLFPAGVTRQMYYGQDIVVDRVCAWYATSPTHPEERFSVSCALSGAASANHHRVGPIAESPLQPAGSLWIPTRVGIQAEQYNQLEYALQQL